MGEAQTPRKSYTEDYSRFGAYEKFFYHVRVVNLETGNAISLTDLFDRKDILKAINDNCSDFECTSAYGSLNEFMNTAKYVCTTSAQMPLSDDLFSGFTLDKLLGDTILVSVVYQNPCENENKGLLNLKHWQLTLPVLTANTRILNQAFGN